jgi:hypothetical protein
MIRGIGPIYASKPVAVFGDQVFKVIEQAPVRLREVPGIGPVRGQRISQAWAEQKVVHGVWLTNLLGGNDDATRLRSRRVGPQRTGRSGL